MAEVEELINSLLLLLSVLLRRRRDMRFENCPSPPTSVMMMMRVGLDFNLAMI